MSKAKITAEKAFQNAADALTKTEDSYPDLDLAAAWRELGIAIANSSACY